MAKKQTVPNSPVAKPNTELFVAQGVTGEALTSAYNNEEQRTDKLKLSDYRQMIDNDGQIQMLYSAIVNTILSAGYSFIDGDSETEEESQELQFIKDVFTQPYWNDGMQMGLGLVIKNMLRAFIDGYRVFEIVYKVREDGLIGIKKIAPRSSITDNGIILLRGDNDEFVGFTQHVSSMGKSVDVTVKNDAAFLKVIKSTLGEEFGSLYGRSGLKSAWYHYDKAHKSMFLNHVGHELGAMKYRLLKVKSGSDTATKAIVNTLERAHEESVLALSDSAFDLSFESMSDASVMEVGLKQQDRHYEMMVRSVLATFMILGGTSSSGNRALGETQSTFFKQGLQIIASTLIDEPINMIIAELIRMNFGTDIIPTYKTKPIDDRASELILNGFTELIKKGSIPDSVTKEIISKTSDKIGLDVDDDVLDTEMQDKANMARETLKAQQNNNQPQMQQTANMSEHIHLNDNEIPELNTRPLFPDEMKVKFADIKVRVDDAIYRSKKILTDKLNSEKQLIVDAYLKASREGKKAISAIEVKLEEVGNENYSEELLQEVLEIMEYGKIIAANELLKSVPNTSKLDRDWATSRVQSIIDEQSARLKFKLSDVANVGLEGKIPENELKLQLEQTYSIFVDRNVNPTASGSIPTAFNKGRQITFDKYKADIFAYRWSAKLENSCLYCTAMDGKIMQDTDPKYYIMTPPSHFGCLCIWVPITNKEQEQYNFEVTGAGNMPAYATIGQFKQLESTSLSEDSEITQKLLELLD